MNYSSKIYSKEELNRYEKSLGRFVLRNTQSKRDYILAEYGLDITTTPSTLAELNFAWACLEEMKKEKKDLRNPCASGAQTVFFCKETGIEFTSQWMIERWTAAIKANGLEVTAACMSTIRSIISVANQLNYCSISNIDDKISGYIHRKKQKQI